MLVPQVDTFIFALVFLDATGRCRLDCAELPVLFLLQGWSALFAL